MFKANGIYDWKLVNRDTGIVEGEGSEHNLVDDRILLLLKSYYSIISLFDVRLLLSSSIPSDVVDYRKYPYPSKDFTVTYESADLTVNHNATTQSIWVSNNFSPPPAPRTYNTIGLRFVYNSGSSQTSLNYPFVSLNLLSLVVLIHPNRLLKFHIYWLVRL